MTEHSRFSPSSAHRWTKCQASWWFEQQYERTTNKWADEGTLKHEVAYHLLEGLELNPQAPFKDDEQVRNYVAYIEGLREAGFETKLEQRVDFGYLAGFPAGKAFGTADCIALKGNRMMVVDFKTGRQWVDVSANLQLILYALGALRVYEGITEVEFVIVQNGDIRTAVYSADQIKSFGYPIGTIIIRLSKIAGEPSLIDYDPSESNCQYCAHNPNCKALIAITKDLDDDLMSRWENIKLIRDHLDAIEARVFAKLKAGEAVGDLKLVAGRAGNRKWNDEKKMEGILIPKGYCEVKIISPTTLEKVDKSLYNELEGEIIRPQTSPVVVKGTDPRPALNFGNDDDFE